MKNPFLDRTSSLVTKKQVCRLSIAYAVILQCLFLLPSTMHAQGYIDMSTQIGGAGADAQTVMKVENGYTYLYAIAAGNNYPVTPGAIQSVCRGVDMTVTKINPDGTVAYATYLGGNRDESNNPLYGGLGGRYNTMEVVNGSVYLVGSTTSAISGTITPGSYPRTITTGPGAAPVRLQSPAALITVTKLNPDGTIAYSRVIGGATGFDNDSYPYEMAVYNGEMYIVGATNCSTFPVVGNSTVFVNTGGASKHNNFIVKLDVSGNMVYSALIGRSTANTHKILADASGIYITGLIDRDSFTPEYAVTDGTTVNAPAFSFDVYAMKLDHNCNRVYTTVMKGNSTSYLYDMKLDNGNVYFSGYTSSPDYPVTNGISYSGGNDAYITRLGNTGSIAFSTFIGGPGFENRGPYIEVDNSSVYAAFCTNSDNLPVANGNTIYNDGKGDVAYCKLNKTDGSISFATYIGGRGPEQLSDLQVVNGEAYIVGIQTTGAYPTTNGSTNLGTALGAEDIIFTKLSTSGNILFSTYLGGSADDEPIAGLAVENGNIYIGGITISTNYPLTLNPAYRNTKSDNFVTRLKMCATGYNIGTGAVTPATQTTCKNGLGQLIVADSIYLPGNAMPIIYRDGVPSFQPGDLNIKYQWQQSNTPGGPWVNIPGGILKDHLPSIAGISQYYRRITISGCKDIIATSNVATVLAGTNTAALANAGGVFHTCPGIAVTIGGSPTASGGLAPYSYLWDMSAGTLANPVVSPLGATIYTLIVTDANGCKSLGQAVVTSDSAYAGADAGFCGGTTGTRIGGAPIAGLSGIVYSWSPAAGLNCSSCAQPTASPSTTTVYTLTMTLPVTGGGTCITTDAVTVTPVAAPVTPGFAGSDIVACLSSTVNPLGTAAEPGFSYTWAPGNYLSANNTSVTNYQPGSTNMPLPNPFAYYLTAAKGGCYFVDSVKVGTIEARAGVDGCGPRFIGEEDRTPDINETYSWTIVSGGGTFVGGATTSSLIRPAVTASPLGSPTTYRLTVTYTMAGGVTQSCTDDVIVFDGCGCSVLLTTISDVGCPSFNLGGGAGRVGIAGTPLYGSVSDYTYAWSPATGLSTTAGQIVYLTDAVERTYTCTITSIADPSFSCSNSILVNDPAWSIPTFAAQDVSTCSGAGINIGQTTVAGYSYLWTDPSNNLSSTSNSNPVATLTASSTFPVIVTDLLSGCSKGDTAIVTVLGGPANAGPDWYVCNNAIVKLGTAALPNTTYSWSPSVSPWQNGTTAASAQPEVLIGANVTFNLTATNTLTGCVSTDQVDIFVNNNPVITNFTDTSVCRGIPVMIGAPALPGVVYSWSPAAGLSNPNIAQPLATPTATVTYTLTATFPGSCISTATDAVTITVHDPSFTLPPISYCPSAGAVALGTSAPAGMSTYSWTPASSVTNPNITNPNTLTPAPSVTTVYELTVRDAFGCSAKNTTTLTPTVTAPIAGENTSICLGTSVQLGSLANTAGATYSWSPATGLNNASIRNPVFTPATEGTTIFTVTKTESGCTSTATVQVVVNSFTIPALASPLVCEGTCVAIGTTAVTGATYAWSPAAGLSNPLISNPTACVTTSTAYTLTAVGINGCIAKRTVMVGVSASPAPTVSIPPVTACFGGGASFNPVISPAGSYSYMWSPNDGRLSDIYVLNPQVQTSFLGTKNYSFAVVNTADGCAGNAIASISINYCTLPAKLESFTATKQTAGVLLNWVISEEVNSQEYDVEFSMDGRTFSSIGTIPATNKRNYSLLHKTPLTGINYYRLKNTDKDGAITYGNIVKVKIDKGSLVNIYPNPAYNNISIAVTGNMLNKPANLNIVSTDGKLVYSKTVNKLNQTEVINVSGMANGKYFVNIVTTNEVVNKAIDIIH